MVQAFDGADLAEGIAASDAHPADGGECLERWFEAIETGRSLGDCRGLVQRREQGPGREIDGQVRAEDRTFELRDHRCAVVAVLGVRGVADPCTVACMLYQNMLKAASRGDQR